MKGKFTDMWMASFIPCLLCQTRRSILTSICEYGNPRPQRLFARPSDNQKRKEALETRMK